MAGRSGRTRRVILLLCVSVLVAALALAGGASAKPLHAGGWQGGQDQAAAPRHDVSPVTAIVAGVAAVAVAVVLIGGAALSARMRRPSGMPEVVRAGRAPERRRARLAA